MATKDFGDGLVTTFQRQLQRRSALLVLDINIRPAREETFCQAPIIFVCRDVQGSVTIPAVGIDIRPVSQKKFGHIPAIFLRSPVQRS